MRRFLQPTGKPKFYWARARSASWLQECCRAWSASPCAEQLCEVCVQHLHELRASNPRPWTLSTRDPSPTLCKTRFATASKAVVVAVVVANVGAGHPQGPSSRGAAAAWPFHFEMHLTVFFASSLQQRKAVIMFQT